LVCDIRIGAESGVSLATFFSQMCRMSHSRMVHCGTLEIALPNFDQVSEYMQRLDRHKEFPAVLTTQHPENGLNTNTNTRERSESYRLRHSNRTCSRRKIGKKEIIEEENGDAGLKFQGSESEERVPETVDWSTVISSFLKRRDG